MDMAEIRLTVSAPMVCRAGSTVATMTSERLTDSGASWTAKSADWAGIATARDPNPRLRISKVSPCRITLSS